MKLALIVPGGVDRSGEVRIIPALLALIRRLTSDHELHVFAMRQEPEPGRWELEGATVHNLGTPFSARRAIRTILSEHRRSPFRLMHSIWADACGALAVGTARLLGIPSIVHVAGGELVALHDISYGGCLTLRRRLLQRSVLRCATAVTAASEPICTLVSSMGMKAIRVPLGVDLSLWPHRRPVRRRSDERARLVHIASLNPVKDQSTLLKAVRILADHGRDFSVDIVGEDTLSGKVQAESIALDVSRHLNFHGFLAQTELRPIVERAHVAIVSSRHEAGPVVAIEAAAAGVPTVGTAVGHIAEWAPDAAIAVPVGDASALASSIERVLDDEEARIRLATAAGRRARSEDADYTARIFNEIYMRLAGSRA